MKVLVWDNVKENVTDKVVDVYRVSCNETHFVFVTVDRVVKIPKENKKLIIECN